MPIEPGQRIDRYLVEAKLGEGGMSQVFRVRHESLGTVRALKVLTLRSKGMASRMRSEGYAQARLLHPHVLAVHDVIDAQGELALLLDFVRGTELGAAIDHGPLPLDEALTVFRAVCAGVGHAHHLGYVHRDLKPANVLLSLEDDPRGGQRVVPKVADFGLVKAPDDEARSHHTRTGAAMGTPAYMAPEQIADAKGVDRRADVWSMGCLLYVLVCGREPFVAPTVLGLFHAIGMAEYPPPTSLRPELPPRVVEAIRGMLTPDPRQRVGDLADVVDFLDGRADTLPVADAALKALPEARDTLALAGPFTLPASSELGRRVAASLVPTPAPAAPRASTPPVDPPPPASRRPLALVAGGILLGAVTVGAWGFALRPSEPVAPQVLPAALPDPTPQEPTPPEPAPSSPPPVPVEPAPVAPAAPVPAARPVQAPAPVPTPAPTPAPSAGARVAVEGAHDVVLVADDGGRYLPPEVPAGTYLVLARFAEATVPAGRVVIPASGDVRLVCTAAMTRCAVR